MFMGGEIKPATLNARFALLGKPCRQRIGYRGVQVLAYIDQLVNSIGTAPSYSMIRDELGFLTTSDVRKVIVRLEARGLVTRSGSGRTRRTTPTF